MELLAKADPILSATGDQMFLQYPRLGEDPPLREILQVALGYNLRDYERFFPDENHSEMDRSLF